jgi:uncharacterized membrane protein YczE
MLVAGIAVVAIGVALTIRADLGVAPYDVLTTGLTETTGLPIGVTAMVLPAVFVAIGLVLGGRPGPGTVIATLSVGPILGAALRLVPEVADLAPRLGLFVVGSALVAVGVTTVVVAEIGPGPAELVTLAIHDRGFPLAPVRTAIELGCVAAGWALGGQAGAGTVVFAVAIGPVLRRLLTAAGYRTHPPAEAATAAAPGA